jgi:hypothetical protein
MTFDCFLLGRLFISETSTFISEKELIYSFLQGHPELHIHYKLDISSVIIGKFTAGLVERNMV